MGCSKGHPRIISCLAGIIEERHGSIEVSNLLKTTHLHEVVENNHVETMRVLLSFKETNRREVHKWKWTLLHHAANKGCLEMVKVVLSDPHLSKDEKQAYFAIENGIGKTAIEVARQRHFGDIVEFLWKERTPSKRTLPEYQSMVSWVCEKGNVKRFLQLLDGAKQQFGDESIVKILQASKDPIPFLSACGGGSIQILRELLSFKEIDMIKLRSEDNENGLHLAASNNHVQVARIILEECALSKEEVNELICEESFEGLKPTHCALNDGRVEMNMYLWERQPSHALEDYFDAICCAVSAPQGSGITFLTHLLASAEKHFRSEMERILNFQPRFGNSPLFSAAENGFIEIVKLLLSFDETDMTLSNGRNYTALHGAADGGHLEVVRFLLESPRLPRSEKMEFIHLRTSGRKTAGDLARSNYHIEVVEVSLKLILIQISKQM